MVNVETLSGRQLAWDSDSVDDNVTAIVDASEKLASARDILILYIYLFTLYWQMWS